MSIDIILSYWYLWIIGLIISPLLAILPQLKNLRKIFAEETKCDPTEFFKPGAFILTVIFGILTFVFFILFVLSLLLSILIGIAA